MVEAQCLASNGSKGVEIWELYVYKIVIMYIHIISLFYIFKFRIFNHT